MNTKQILIFAIVLCLSSIAKADVNQLMDEALQVSSGSHTYGNTYGETASLGYWRLYAPKKSFTLINVSPPRINAGCGGIDLYGGSFSYMRGAQLRALLKQILAQAEGYLFKLALNALCPQCNAVLENVASTLNSLNQYTANTCKLSAGIASFAYDSVTGSKSKIAADAQTIMTGAGASDAWESAQKVGSNYVDAVTSAFSRVPTMFDSANGSAAANNSAEAGGGSIQKLNAFTDNSLNTMTPILEGFSTVSIWNALVGGNYASFKTGSSAKELTAGQVPMISVKELFNGFEGNAANMQKSILVCKSSTSGVDPDVGCDTVSTEKILDTKLEKGFKRVFRAKLVGSGLELGNDNDLYGRPSICGKLKTEGLSKLTSEEFALLGMFPSIVHSYTVATQATPSRACKLLGELSDRVAAAVFTQIMTTQLNTIDALVANHPTKNNDIINMDQMKKGLDKVREDLFDLQKMSEFTNADYAIIESHLQFDRLLTGMQ